MPFKLYVNDLRGNAHVRIYKIPVKMVKIVSEVTASPLTELVNESLFKHFSFPGDEKHASVT